MNIVGLTVIHKAFGRGIAVTLTDSHVTVRFDAGDKTFQYPDAFETYLSLEDSAAMAAIRTELQARKAAREAKAAEEKARRARTVAPPAPPPPPPARQTAPKTPSARAATGRAPMQPRSSGQRTRTRSAAAPEAHGSMVFKCNYCNGGKNMERIGYHGACSDKVIEYNINRMKRVWCSQPTCPCRRYLDGELSRKELDELAAGGGLVCYEGQMLRDWRAYAGVNHSGEKKGEVRRLLGMRRGGLAVLTTRSPHTEEKERVIFAAFLVGEVLEGGVEGAEGYVAAHPDYRVQLTPNQCRKVLYWTYHANDSQPDQCKWGSGLYRYLTDEQGVQILRDIARVKEGEPDEAAAKKLLEHYCQVNSLQTDNIGAPTGALTLREW